MNNSSAKDIKLTPLMRQFFPLKAQFNDSLLLFQVGDFYELFFDDALKASKFLGIVLTQRGKFKEKPIPICGFPVSSLNFYLAKLIKGGFKLAVCDQIEAATPGKTVARAITSTFTPGTLSADNLLDAKRASFLFVFFPTKSGFGCLFAELLTAKLYATVLNSNNLKELETELYRFFPDEILFLNIKQLSNYAAFFKARGFYTTSFTANFDKLLIDSEASWLEQQFDAISFENLAKFVPIKYALILWKLYLEKNQKTALSQFKSIEFYSPERFLLLDSNTQRNLDLVRNSADGSSNNTLFELIDKAVTNMGSRRLKSWLLSPLRTKSCILERQEVLQFFLDNILLFKKIKLCLSNFSDIQRITGRIALNKASLQDYCNLAHSLEFLAELYNLLNSVEVTLIKKYSRFFCGFESLCKLLKESCNTDFEQSFFIKIGYNSELDSLRYLVENSDKKILEIEARERLETAINSLKIVQSQLYGYCIEVTKTHLAAIPSHYVRQQTLSNKERYSTQELQLLQLEILNASSKFKQFDKALFNSIEIKVKAYISKLSEAATALSELDALVGLASLAADNSYVCPIFNDQKKLQIIKGRHPVIAAKMPQAFVANDIIMDEANMVLLLTGPNMGGKSTYLRQVALICILAQLGSFVPADFASLPLLDKIFTRIGAGDNLAEGKSTFLLEMEETAQICLYATADSLVILDEVGRGTATFDGMALAQAIIEYLYKKVQVFTLFATHYHELTKLENEYLGIKNYFAVSQQTASGIVFLHKIIRGKASGSFGLEVAKLAQIPESIILRAKNILKDLSN